MPKVQLTVPAKELRVGDHIINHGTITSLGSCRAAGFLRIQFESEVIMPTKERKFIIERDAAHKSA